MQLRRPTHRPTSMARIASVLGTALLLSACASGGSSSSLNNDGGTATVRQMMSLAGAHFADPNELNHEVLTVDTVYTDPATTWKGVIGAYRALRIPVTRYDENMLW